MVTHETHVAERADRIVHMLDGRVETGGPAGA
jgi:predicted ABC-type transport system involved in lysophospholipase L1 biosynthesis ATPase subunit